MNKILKVLVISFGILSYLFAEERLCRYIDFGHLTFEQIQFLQDVKPSIKEIKYTQEFNDAYDIGEFIQLIKNEYNIEVAIETGTSFGHTTAFLGSCFNEVYTIEIRNDEYSIVKNILQSHDNVYCFLGSSEKILNDLLPQLQEKKILFYLDAHHCGWYWPLLDELDAISKTHCDQCIVVIDDFKVPGREDILYDSYDNNDCCYSYIEPKLQQIFSDFDCYFVIPSDIECRAKFLAIPKSWTKLSNITCGNLSQEIF